MKLEMIDSGHRFFCSQKSILCHRAIHCAWDGESRLVATRLTMTTDSCLHRCISMLPKIGRASAPAAEKASRSQQEEEEARETCTCIHRHNAGLAEHYLCQASIWLLVGSSLA